MTEKPSGRKPEQMERLDRILLNVVDTLERGQSDIFDIAEECHHQAANMEVQLKEISDAIARSIAEVSRLEQLERYARLRLMEVSRNFRSNSEETIKEVYEKARELQVTLANARQEEAALRQRRDEMGRQQKKIQEIAIRADGFLGSTGTALKILRGNVEKISDTMEESVRRQQMEMWIIESQEAERRKIARDLHDGPAQSLAGILIRLDLIKQLWEGDMASIAGELNSIQGMGRETLSDIRRIMFDLKPSLFHEENFSTTLLEYFNDFEDKYNFRIEFMPIGSIGKYELPLEIALFRLVQEAITNVKKHAGVKRAMVKIEDTGTYLTIVIKDDGCGFDPEAISSEKERYGIIGMKERVGLFGGELDIISSPGSGTQVIVKVPLEGEAGLGKNKSTDS
ncbi:MAG: sensor histidine kinase [Deltaproteobacteria bacterium]